MTPLPSLLASVGDPGRTRTVYASILFLIALGVTLIAVAIWLVRSTRRDPEVLAPLEVMGQRRWLKGDPASQRRRLDEVRPPGAVPLDPSAPVPVADAAFDAGPPGTGFDDFADLLLLPPPAGEAIVPDAADAHAAADVGAAEAGAAEAGAAGADAAEADAAQPPPGGPDEGAEAKSLPPPGIPAEAAVEDVEDVEEVEEVGELGEVGSTDDVSVEVARAEGVDVEDDPAGEVEVAVVDDPSEDPESAAAPDAADPTAGPATTDTERHDPAESGRH